MTEPKSPPVAVVLAAGLGSRLRAVHAAPKGFVSIDGVPIIARSVAALRRAGVEEFVFVVGWRASNYVEWMATLGDGVRHVVNDEYATTGSLRSLLLGAAAVPQRDLVVVESDLLYDPRATELLLEAPSPDTLLMSGFTQSGDEVWVYGDDARLARLSKTAWEDRAPLGELVGLTRLSASTVDAMAAAAVSLPASAHYEDGINVVAGERPITLLHAPDLVWCEIDDEHHLDRARRLIWPRIVSS